MAGITGIKANGKEKKTVRRMLDTIEHRGPDTLKVHHTGKISAGVRALSQSGARGDGYARKGNVAVLLDGDIYNERKGARSDADVALELYLRHGRTFSGHLEGVFACAVIDGNEVILARDAVGVRPLYYGTTKKGDLCFASELKALVGVADNVKELPPAVGLSSDVGMFDVVTHYPDVKVPRDPKRAAKALRDCMFRATERRMADGAVGGTFLSGGLDSSIIAAIGHEIDPKLPGFTVGVEGAPDLDNAILMAKHLGMKHYIHIFDADDIVRMVPRAVRTLESFDEDCVSGTIANLIASGFASEHARCMLSGEGGDELNGGYHLLKDLPSDEARLKMLRQLIAIAYNTAVQRLDRSMMGNSVHYRTPFIDSEVIAFCLQIPVSWKIKRVAGKKVEKWLLREAFKDMLPREIYNRPKLRFAGGTGTDNLMDRVAKGKLGATRFNAKTRRTSGGYVLNTPKELWYYKLFKKNFPGPDYEKLVGRWDPNK
jgi:asparagine synthase (glutamine-hydrolysing)